MVLGLGLVERNGCEVYGFTWILIDFDRRNVLVGTFRWWCLG